MTWHPIFGCFSFRWWRVVMLATNERMVEAFEVETNPLEHLARWWLRWNVWRDLVAELKYCIGKRWMMLMLNDGCTLTLVGILLMILSRISVASDFRRQIPTANGMETIRSDSAWDTGVPSRIDWSWKNHAGKHRLTPCHPCHDH